MHWKMLIINFFGLPFDRFGWLHRSFFSHFFDSMFITFFMTDVFYYVHLITHITV
jgi:hypothetical protein